MTLSSTTVLLYPLYHPAAALYTPSMLRALEEDFARLPDLLGHATVTSVTPVVREPLLRAPEPARRNSAGELDRSEAEATLVGAVQLGLF